MQAQNYGAAANVMNQTPATGSAGGGAPAQPRQRVRARRGQATDPHSIAERVRFTLIFTIPFYFCYFVLVGLQFCLAAEKVESKWKGGKKKKKD